MRTDGIKGAVCSFFNGLEKFSGCPFVKSPANSAAPAGTYIAVRVEGVEQSGSMTGPPPGEGATFAFQQVATVSLVEVEGDGDFLRMARDAIQTRAFRDAAAKAGFTVWDWTSIVPVDTFDGEFVVRQWRFTFTANFADTFTADVPKIASVEPITLKGG